jgi:catechol 2,3-dioxygenase
LDLASVADGLVLKGRHLLWGVGRHGPGNNIFSYYIDVNGTVVETSFGMERFDENPRDPGIWTEAELARVFDVWGTEPPAHYGTVLTPFVI